jgi:hypothetical protein
MEIVVGLRKRRTLMSLQLIYVPLFEPGMVRIRIKINCVSTAVTLASVTKAKTAVSALCSVVSAECTPLHQAIQNTRPLKLQEIKIRSGDNCIELKIERHTVFLVYQRILCSFSIWILLDEWRLILFSRFSKCQPNRVSLQATWISANPPLSD